VVTRLSGALRGAHLQGGAGGAERLRRQLEELAASVAALVGGSGAGAGTGATGAEAAARAVLEVQGGQVSLDGVPLRPGFADVVPFRFLAEQLATRGVRRLVLEGAATVEELEALVRALEAHPPGGERPFAALLERLGQLGVRRVRLEEARGGAGGAGALQEAPRGRREAAVLLLYQGLEAVAEVMAGVEAGRGVGFVRARRFVHGAVDLLEQDRGLLLALTTARGVGDYLHQHAVNVSLLTLVAGRRLGMSRRALAQAGMAALLRDVGKATVDRALREKRGELTGEDWEAFRRFPHAAVVRLLRFRGGLSEASLRHLLVAFEHPLRVDGGRTRTGRPPGFLSRLLQLADAYDAMTSPRPYRPRPLTPPAALSLMVRDRTATGADPLLLRAFIHALGLYPVGSVVLLSTGELAVVCEPPAGPSSLASPRVRIATDAEGRPLARPLLSGTAGPAEAGADGGAEDGSPLPRITRVVDPWESGLDVPRLLLGLPPVPAAPAAPAAPAVP
jgi:HD-GYP domain-containing protein (c-di-GMP phosphodiesterase class II)